MDEFSDFPFEFSVAFPEAGEFFKSPLSFDFEDVNLTLLERLELFDLSPVFGDFPFEIAGVLGVSCLDFPVFNTSCLDFAEAAAAGVDVSSSFNLPVLCDSASSFLDLPAIFGPALPALLPVLGVV